MSLARDISKQGLSPIERFLVIASADEPSDFVVLEGNRRLTALKLLMNPDLAEPVFGKAAVRTLRELATDLQYKADTPVDCAIVESRDEAVHWLRLRHGVGLDGAGTERWGTPEQERFDLRNGKISPEMKVLNFLTDRNAITPEQAESISMLPVAAELQVSAIPVTGGNRNPKAVKHGHPSKRRATVAPSHLSLKIQNTRIKDICREPQRLNPNFSPRV